MSNAGTSPEIVAYYAGGVEVGRLDGALGQLELLRTQEVLGCYLPPPPAVVLDVGGGPGVYSCWLAGLGYEVHLVDPVPSYIEEALRCSQASCPVASATVGDARELAASDSSADIVLLMGPLYHLQERGDRLTALGEAWRVLKRGGCLFAVGVSRFASALDGLFRGALADPGCEAMVECDLRTGKHTRPAGKEYWTTAYLHHPSELKEEVAAAGFEHLATIGLDGPGWLLPDFEERWQDPAWRERILNLARALEVEPALLGISGHIMAVARKG